MCQRFSGALKETHSSHNGHIICVRCLQQDAVENEKFDLAAVWLVFIVFAFYFYFLFWKSCL